MDIHQPIIVATKSGKLEGCTEGGQCVFKGIPYAAPPVGALRWHSPQPVVSWNGVRPAKEFGPIAPQNTMPGSEIMANLMATERRNENCLFLNIWTPGIDDARRPVMVWIHGGAFLIGSGSQDMFRGNTLVSNRNIVLVTINYRMGALGFMNLKEITGGKVPATGCEGLLDQIAALDWVHANIEAFGGDPDNITVFGESAGAMSIGDLMGMPAARGKFQKAIMESGGANTVSSLEGGVSAAAEFLNILGLRGQDTAELYSLTVEQIMNAQEKLGFIMRERDNRITPFQPVVDGVVMPEIPIEAIRKGSASHVKTLAGTNLDEFKLFNVMNPGFRKINEAGMIAQLENMIPANHVSPMIAAYRDARRNRGENAEATDILTAVQSDLMFRIPVLQLVEAQCKSGQPAYNYLFNWKSPALRGRLGACHALEIGFVFGNYEKSFCGTGPDADALSRKIQDAWTTFAYTGDPSCKSLTTWKLMAMIEQQ
jgi:para-nitrobenzyl esterase